MHLPRIALCTTCKGRLQHLSETLPKNLIDNADYPDVIIVLVDYNSKDDLENWLKANVSGWIAGGRLVVYRFAEPGPFRMAHAKNLAHRCALAEGADILVNLDADNFSGAGFASWVAATIGENDTSFLMAKPVREGPDRTPRGISGRIAVSRHAFVKSGGYDERYATWSPDDKDFNLRLRMLGYEGLSIPARFLGAVMHNDRMRFREYPHVANDLTLSETFAAVNPEGPIANFGRIGLGTVFRNFSPSPVRIDPLPTRVFGIGMHKTGTTSLHSAFGQLGLQSAHWPSAHWARRVWEEVSRSDRSDAVNRIYAGTDLPFPLLYQKLDAAYPNSSFVLTRRSEANWSRSVERHFSDINPFRSAWGVDPFSHAVHKLLYGQRHFEARLFLERYRRHNAEALEYFNGSGRLLIMDFDEGAGWHELCAFLGLPVPVSPFPNLSHIPSTEYYS